MDTLYVAAPRSLSILCGTVFNPVIFNGNVVSEICEILHCFLLMHDINIMLFTDT